MNKSEEYAAEYPTTIVDRTPQTRNWVWQIAMDNKRDAAGRPVVAYTHIDDVKTTHEYWRARWDGHQWLTTAVAPAGHAFHQNWDKTERCYSGGMAIDPDDTNQLYLSIPTKGADCQSPLTSENPPTFDRDGTPEIWHYTLAADGTVAHKEPVTNGSAKGNARPYVIPGSALSKMRLLWMQGDYYYWMVNKWYPKGYPTAIVSDWEGFPSSPQPSPVTQTTFSLSPGKPVGLTLHPDTANYSGTLFTATLPDRDKAVVTYRLSPDTYYPEVVIGDRTFRSQNRLLTSDAWAQGSTGTNGDSHPMKRNTVDLTLCYDGHTLIILRDGYVDQVVDF